ncbi:hypothetical protein AABB24_016213 [Solanum stoloniferum]|uniref:Uncharacterized protein n=1 Tax=Solanum stoloniferum TaxID=62892 RepID=A0ABD2TVX8_9SOLN
MKNHTSDIDECLNQLQGCNFTRDQYSQMLQMLKQNQGYGHKVEDACQTHEVQANTACKPLLVFENNEVWIIDTWASNHMVSKIGMLTSESVVKVKDPKHILTYR